MWPPRKACGVPKRKHKKVSPQDRQQITDCSRRGSDLVQLAALLNVHIKTARPIARSNRDEAKKRGGAHSRYGSNVAETLKEIVDSNHSYTLAQIVDSIRQRCPEIQISASSVNRLLDGHGHTTKLLSHQPVDRNRADVKEARKVYAAWLQNEGLQVMRYYVDETNYNIWCSRTFGRSQQGTTTIKSRTSTKGANVNIVACMSASSLLEGPQQGYVADVRVSHRNVACCRGRRAERYRDIHHGPCPGA